MVNISEQIYSITDISQLNEIIEKCKYCIQPNLIAPMLLLFSFSLMVFLLLLFDKKIKRIRNESKRQLVYDIRFYFSLFAFAMSFIMLNLVFFPNL